MNPESPINECPMCDSDTGALCYGCETRRSKELLGMLAMETYQASHRDWLLPTVKLLHERGVISDSDALCLGKALLSLFTASKTITEVAEAALGIDVARMWRAVVDATDEDRL